jgi:hypothetical protein
VYVYSNRQLTNEETTGVNMRNLLTNLLTSFAVIFDKLSCLGGTRNENDIKLTGDFFHNELCRRMGVSRFSATWT